MSTYCGWLRNPARPWMVETLLLGFRDHLSTGRISRPQLKSPVSLRVRQGRQGNQPRPKRTNANCSESSPTRCTARVQTADSAQRRAFQTSTEDDGTERQRMVTYPPEARHTTSIYIYYYIILYYIILYCIVLYCIVLYCIVLYCIVLYCM